MTRPLASLAITVLGLSCVAARVDADSLRNVHPGESVPEFSLSTTEGGTISTDELRGKVVCLVFLSAEQRSSEAAAAEAHAVHEELGREGVSLVYVTADVVQTDYFRLLRDRLNVHEPLGLDFDRKLYGGLGLIVQPTTIVIDKDWKLAHVISAHPADYQHILRAYARHALGKIDDAELAEELKAERFTRDRPQDLIARHRAAAGLLRKNGLYADAEGELRSAIAIDPTHAETLLDLASLFLATDRVDEAAAIVDAVLAEQPNQRRGELIHGVVLYRQGKLDDAATTLKRALLLNPDPVIAHYYLGLIAEQKGDLPGAIEHFKQSLTRLLPDRPL